MRFRLHGAPVLLLLLVQIGGQPTLPPNPGFPSCDICGEGNGPFERNNTVTIPGQSPLLCGALIDGALLGYITPNNCENVRGLAFVQCECDPRESNLTDAPNTASPAMMGSFISDSPVTPQPTATTTSSPSKSPSKAPTTTAPVTASSVTPKPTTMSPSGALTESPSKAAPITNAPVVSSSPVPNPPLSAAPMAMTTPTATPPVTEAPLGFLHTFTDAPAEMVVMTVTGVPTTTGATTTTTTTMTPSLPTSTVLPLMTDPPSILSAPTIEPPVSIILPKNEGVTPSAPPFSLIVTNPTRTPATDNAKSPSIQPVFTVKPVSVTGRKNKEKKDKEKRLMDSKSRKDDKSMSSKKGKLEKEVKSKKGKKSKKNKKDDKTPKSGKKLQHEDEEDNEKGRIDAEEMFQRKWLRGLR